MADINHGVEYKFLAPIPPKNSNRRHSRGRRRHHSDGYKWRMKMLGQCSRSCGGGSQTLVPQCVMTGVSRVVPDTRCDQAHRPVSRSVPCNRQPCPADWSAGDWGTCSVTCGPGVQERRVTCRQELAGGVSIPVSSELCPGIVRNEMLKYFNLLSAVTRSGQTLPGDPKEMFTAGLYHWRPGETIRFSSYHSHSHSSASLLGTCSVS